MQLTVNTLRCGKCTARFRNPHGRRTITEHHEAAPDNNSSVTVLRKRPESRILLPDDTQSVRFNTRTRPGHFSLQTPLRPDQHKDDPQVQPQANNEVAAWIISAGSLRAGGQRR